MQRADAPSAALLPNLADRLAKQPVLIVVATRPSADAADALEHTLAPMLTETIHLGPLGPDESRRLIDAIATEPLSDESRRLVLAHSEGNPGRLVRGVFFEPALRAVLDDT